MKKNRALRLAALMLVLVMMTSCFVGGTFAKYTTSSTGAASARVAHWGFSAPAELTIDLFDGEYQNVDAANDANVIAPGTSKETQFSFGYKSAPGLNAYAPEVAYTVNADAEVTGSYASLDANTNFKWTFNDENYNTVAELVAAVEALDGSETGAKEYAAGEKPPIISEVKIGWVWEFETEDDLNTNDDEMAAQDAIDTEMGNAQVESGGLDNVSITITITATQID